MKAKHNSKTSFTQSTEHFSTSIVHSLWCTLRGRNLTSCFYKWKEKDLLLFKSTIENSWNPKLSAYVLYGLSIYISELFQWRTSQILKSTSEKPIYTLLITKVDFFILHKLVPSEVSQIPWNCSSRWLWAIIWVLGMKYRFSGIAASALYWGTISPAPLFLVYESRALLFSLGWSQAQGLPSQPPKWWGHKDFYY